MSQWRGEVLGWKKLKVTNSCGKFIESKISPSKTFLMRCGQEEKGEAEGKRVLAREKHKDNPETGFIFIRGPRLKKAGVGNITRKAN